MSDMEYNECVTCGAKDGRCGLTIDGECENCRNTRSSGEVRVCANLIRTEAELQKTMAILDKPASPEVKYANIDALADAEMTKTSVMTIKWETNSEGAYPYVSVISWQGATRDFIFRDSFWILAGTWTANPEDKALRDLIVE